jgi:hypothetical protein
MSNIEDGAMSKRIHMSIRIQPKSNTRLGGLLEYLQKENSTLKEEFIDFLEMKYLPGMLQAKGQTKAARQAAHKSIGEMQGIIESIRNTCQIDHPETLKTKTFEEKTKLPKNGGRVKAITEITKTMFGD